MLVFLKDAHRYVPYFQRKMCADVRASLRKMLENIGFEILHCSKREKSYQYSKQSLKSTILNDKTNYYVSIENT